jgi:hypothetical protein
MPVRYRIPKAPRPRRHIRCNAHPGLRSTSKLLPWLPLGIAYRDRYASCLRRRHDLPTVANRGEPRMEIPDNCSIRRMSDWREGPLSKHMAHARALNGWTAETT